MPLQLTYLEPVNVTMFIRKCYKYTSHTCAAKSTLILEYELRLMWPRVSFLKNVNPEAVRLLYNLLKCCQLMYFPLTCIKLDNNYYLPLSPYYNILHNV